MIDFILVSVLSLLLLLAYRLGVIVEREHWRYGIHFIQNHKAYRFVRDSTGNLCRKLM